MTIKSVNCHININGSLIVTKCSGPEQKQEWYIYYIGIVCSKSYAILFFTVSSLDSLFSYKITYFSFANHGAAHGSNSSRLGRIIVETEAMTLKEKSSEW